MLGAMLLTAVVLDTSMTASAVLARLARHGYWTDAARPEVHAWLAEQARRLRITVDDVARRVARDPHRVGVALRRQLDMEVPADDSRC